MGLVAVLLAFALHDSRDANVKADSILFSVQSFDKRFDLPTNAQGGPARYCYVDLPTPQQGDSKAPILFLIHGKANYDGQLYDKFPIQAVQSVATIICVFQLFRG